MLTTKKKRFVTILNRSVLVIKEMKETKLPKEEGIKGNPTNASLR